MRTSALSLSATALFGLHVAPASGFAAVSGLLSKRGIFNMAASGDDLIAAMDDVGMDVLNAAMDEAEAQAGGGGEGPGPSFNVRDLPGITDPLGFFDPAGFCEDATEGKIRFYREVEVRPCTLTPRTP